jgi:hypothetical protein
VGAPMTEHSRASLRFGPLTQEVRLTDGEISVMLSLVWPQRAPGIKGFWLGVIVEPLVRRGRIGVQNGIPPIITLDVGRQIAMGVPGSKIAAGGELLSAP